MPDPEDIEELDSSEIDDPENEPEDVPEGTVPVAPVAAADPDTDDADEDEGDDEEDDVLNGLTGTDEVVGKLRETDKNARAMRAAMESQGWTFDADNNPVPPPAAPAPKSAAPESPAPPAEAPAPLTEWKGFAVAPHGLTLHDPAFDDPDSDEYADLVYGMVDADGNVVQEGIGEAEYLRRLHSYQRAQDDFGAHVDDTNNAAVQQGYATFAAEFNATNEKLKEWLAPAGAEAAESVVRDFTPKATGIIEQLRADLTQELIDSGIPKARALSHVNAQLIKTPGLYQRALAQSIVENEDDFKDFVTRIAGKGSAAAAAATPAKPNAPRPPIPPIARGAGSPAAAERPAKPSIIPTAEETKIANDLGVDPVKFATKRRSAEYNA